MHPSREFSDRRSVLRLLMLPSSQGTPPLSLFSSSSRFRRGLQHP